ncbi:DUF4394 domain-containing protein [Oleiharenicola lentus]|uniref:DUF4394 domain-containing protein n=1 Tax=Oleiharenicola lentus TaxID=2508720 RepID=UPI003F679E16
MHKHIVKLALVSVFSLAAAAAGFAQTGYGVNAAGDLFSFNLATPSSQTTIGNLGFTPVGIDFRPGSNSLYALQVGATTTQLYTVNLSTAAVTAVGSGFASVAGGYNLASATSFGFDFNPRTLQGDLSARIRLTTNLGDNLRLHDTTGGLAAEDGDVNGIVGSLIGASAYINSNTLQAAAGTPATALYNIDYANDFLVLQNPPNNGTIANVGSGLGVDFGANIAGDIFTVGGVNTFYVVNTVGGNASLYTVDLTTGLASFQSMIAGGDFTGGFAVAAIPEPADFAAAAAALMLGVAIYRRKRNATKATATL